MGSALARDAPAHRGNGFPAQLWCAPLLILESGKGHGMLSPTPPECGEGGPGRRGERLEPKARGRHVSGCGRWGRNLFESAPLTFPEQARHRLRASLQSFDVGTFYELGRYRTIHIPNGIVYRTSAGVQLQKCKMTLAVAKSCGPGRPKDLEKRAAILAAAKRLFPLLGFEGTSMDAIAAEASLTEVRA